VHILGDLRESLTEGKRTDTRISMGVVLVQDGVVESDDSRMMRKRY
jgi:hypothetical protein